MRYIGGLSRSAVVAGVAIVRSGRGASALGVVVSLTDHPNSYQPCR